MGVSDVRDRGAPHRPRDAVIFRAEPVHLEEAWGIVSEYYEAVGVQLREDFRAFADEYFGAGSGVWLAKTGGAVVGCIALRPLPEIPGAAEVKRLYVQPSSRGEGIAERLLRTLEAFANEAGYEWLYLD